MSIVATLGVGPVPRLLRARSSTPGRRPGRCIPQPTGLPVVPRRRAARHAGLLRHARSCRRSSCSRIALFLQAQPVRPRRSAPRRPTPKRRGWPASSPAGCRRWRGRIAGALVGVHRDPHRSRRRASSARDGFGPALLLRALTARGDRAGCTSLPLALAGGVGLGVLEQLLLWNYPQSGLVEVALFVVILVALLLQRQRGGRDEEKGSWAAVQALRPLPRAAAAAAGQSATLAPVLRRRRPDRCSRCCRCSSPTAMPVTLTGMIGFAIVGLSVGVLTGLGGQLTPGPVRGRRDRRGRLVPGVEPRSATSRSRSSTPGSAARLVSRADRAARAAHPRADADGDDARLRAGDSGLAARQPWMLGDGAIPASRPAGRSAGRSTPATATTTSRSSSSCCALLLARNIRRSGFGRLLVAIRDNEDNARAFTVRASVVKLQGYLLAGFIAGIGGATLRPLAVAPSTRRPSRSLRASTSS